MDKTVEQISNMLKNAMESMNRMEQEEKVVKAFEDMLDNSDIEVQIRYNYIEELLNQCNDEIYETTEKIEKLKVEIDLYTRLENMNKVRHLQNQLENLEEKLSELEDKYEVLEDMWENEYFAILA